MAKGNLTKVLQELDKSLEKSSEAYRTLVSNKQAHYIIVNKKDIKQQITQQLSIVEKDGRFQGLTEGLKKIIDTEVDNMYEYLATNLHPSKFETNRRKYLTSNYSKGSNILTVVLETKEGTEPRDVFAYFRRIKQRSQRNLVKKLNVEIKKLNARNKNKREEVQASDFLDIGHIGSSAVSLQRKAAVQKTLYNFSQQQNPTVRKFLSSVADDIGIKLEKTPSKKKVGGKEVISITLESSRLNKKEGREKLAALAGDLNKKLFQVAETYGEQWADLKGSPSAIDRAEQQILNQFAKINGKKNFKAKTLSKNKSSTTLKRKTKAKKGNGFKDSKKAPPVTFGRIEDKQQSPIQLMGLLNAKLPRTVANNMGSPSLENVTGRFAASVRVTDVTRTPQGFPSIGYTYQRDPYGVFEASSGTRFASTERDPRTLIDASIREIAVELITTRLYTRRL